MSDEYINKMSEAYQNDNVLRQFIFKLERIISCARVIGIDDNCSIVYDGLTEQFIKKIEQERKEYINKAYGHVIKELGI